MEKTDSDNYLAYYDTAWHHMLGKVLSIAYRWQYLKGKQNKIMKNKKWKKTAMVTAFIHFKNRNCIY